MSEMPGSSWKVSGAALSLRQANVCRDWCRHSEEAWREIEVWQLAPEGLQDAGAGALPEHGTGLEASLRELVRLRVSLMNGCEYCIRLHTSELQKAE